MAARNVTETPPRGVRRSQQERSSAPDAGDQQAARYRPLPTGTHGLDPELVKRDQRERLQNGDDRADRAEGLPGGAHRRPGKARARLAADLLQPVRGQGRPVPERLRRGRRALRADGRERLPRRRPRDERLAVAMRAWAELAAAEPEATLAARARRVRRGRKGARAPQAAYSTSSSAVSSASRDGEPPSADPTDLTVKAILGGIREVTVDAPARGSRA